MANHGLENLSLEIDKNRIELFTESAARLGMQPAAVEKDFWLCWALQRIFSNDELRAQLLFKGGTSLSKCYGLIERFSEDIDFILDWTRLTDEDPYEQRSNTQQDKFNKAMEQRAVVYVCDQLLPSLSNLFNRFKLEIKPEQPKSILLFYPKLFRSSYIKPVIELEFSPMSAMVPNRNYQITPYCSNLVPSSVGDTSFYVNAIRAIKTFWDKVTILHCEAHRPKDKQQPMRYSRHYYDLYKMLRSPVKSDAMNERGLLPRTFEFKHKFYPQGFANYRDAIEGQVRLIPEVYRLKQLAEDYASMKEMIFGPYPSWGEIIKLLAEFEQELQ